MNQLSLRGAKGSFVRLFVRAPEPDDVDEFYTDFAAKGFNQKAIYYARRKLGERLITGIEKGCIEVEFNGKGWVPLCSDEKDPDYLPDWKERLVKDYSDFVMGVGAFFEEQVRAGASERE